MTKYDGGYLVIAQPLIRAGLSAHTAALPSPVSPTMLRAVNLIQAVPWRVNAFVLDVMREAYVNGDTVGDLPPADDIPLPPPLPEAVWMAMTPEQRSDHKVKLAGIHGQNAGYIASREALLRKLQIAEDMRNEPAIWFPHNIDFRGRVYPMTQDLNPQGDDITKSLLMFAEGKPLGKRGAYWLAIGLAGTFGNDKWTFEERVRWVEDNHDNIRLSASDPLGQGRWWATAGDSPWLALAFCREYAGYLEQGEEWVSHIPVCLDGSCNGLQHLAAMGLDRDGAVATNLTGRGSKADLYNEVAKLVIRRVERDASAGVEEAIHWSGKVTRSTVKRAVMTTPYGVTARGIRDQLIGDRHTASLDGSPLKNADYLRDCITEALEGTVKSARDIMAYIQDVAKALADADRPLCWSTPAGMMVRQAYYNQNRTKIETVCGRAVLWSEDKNLGLNARKQVLASAPNVIHSFDAAHLARTVTAAHDRHGLTSFAFIHDSYGTHACDLDTLAAVLRLEFVEIYRSDTLAAFDAEVRAMNPDIELPALPAKGTFNVDEVLTARYFFS